MTPAKRAVLFGGRRLIGPLDLVSGAAAAYSVSRKLRQNYTGALIRLRRSSDNAEQDIYPASGGILDSVAAALFVGGGTGHIVTLYDQSGNGLAWTQATAGAQLPYVASVTNGRAGARLDGTNHFLARTGLAVAAGGVFAVAGNKSANTSTLMGEYRTDNDSRRWTMGVGATGLWRWITSSDGLGASVVVVDSAVSAVAYAVLSSAFSAGANQFWVNGTSIASNATNPYALGTADLANATMSGAATYGARFAGDYLESIVLSAAPSTAQRQLIERNQGAFYGVTVA